MKIFSHLRDLHCHQCGPGDFQWRALRLVLLYLAQRILHLWLSPSDGAQISSLNFEFLSVFSRDREKRKTMLSAAKQEDFLFPHSPILLLQTAFALLPLLRDFCEP